MASTSADGAQIKEREIPRSTKDMVDACWEEGNYELGIKTLDTLRTPKHVPSMSHIRHLLYIALYPPKSTSQKAKERAMATPSPQKVNGRIQFQRNNDKTIPSPDATQMALTLLNAFTLTNSPSSLMRALPSYAPVGGVRFGSGLTDDREVCTDDTLIGKDTMVIGRAKDCWAILAEGFITRHDAPPEDSDDEMEDRVRHPVGKHSWGVLEWLIGVFERDEELAEKKNDDVRRSTLLLAQIPQARSGPQWDVTTPLNIIFDAFSRPSEQLDAEEMENDEMDPYHADLGGRLMSLLLNLTVPPSPPLSPSHFVLLSTPKLPLLPASNLNAFLSAIPMELSGFKLALLCEYLRSYSDGVVANKKGANAVPAKGALKAKLKSGLRESTGSRASVEPVPSLAPNARTYATPSVPNLLVHLASRPSTASSSGRKHMIVKFHLLSEVSCGPISGLDEWRKAVADGSVRNAIIRGYVERLPADVEEATLKNLCLELLQSV